MYRALPRFNPKMPYRIIMQDDLVCRVSCACYLRMPRWNMAALLSEAAGLTNFSFPKPKAQKKPLRSCSRSPSEGLLSGVGLLGTKNPL